MIFLWATIEAYQMEGGEGMVAVVRGLRDAGLAVTLLDGNRHYTLMPNTVTNTTTSTSTAPLYNHVQQRSQQTQQTQYQQGYNVNMFTDTDSRNECGAQAVDGRYASTYKTTHCNVSPTSPPEHLSEFPPQRSHVHRGHGNFQVGGTGSGDTTHRLPKHTGSFRGGMCWPDRGSVCTPRPSQEMDAFASSLRKYPSVSPDRSTEIVERLISYTQHKNASKYLQSRTHQSPSRVSDMYSSSQNLDRSSRNSTKSLRYYENYVPDVRVRQRTEEAPTRDIRFRPSESPTRAILEKSYDIRYMRDNMAKRVREIKWSSSHPNPNLTRDRDNSSLEHKRLQNTLVNIEIQADVKMVSRETATVPRVDPPKRTVAVSHSTPESADNRTSEGAVSQINNKQTQPESTDLFKTIPTTLYPVKQYNLRKPIHTTLSFTDLDSRWRCIENVRKSRSEEELRVNEDIYLIRNVVLNAHNNMVASSELGNMFKDYDFNTNKGERFRFHIGRCDNKWSECCHTHQCKHLNDVNDKPRQKIRGDNSICVYRAEITPFRVPKKDDELENIIHDWINMLEMKSHDFLGRSVDRANIFNTVTNRLKFLINGKPKYDVLNNLRSEIMDIVKDIPIEMRGYSNKWIYRKNNVVDSLFNKVKGILSEDITRSNETREIEFSNMFFNQDLDRGQPLHQFRKYIQLTEEEIKEFITAEMMELLEKFHLTIDSWNDIEVEITDILLDSIEAICRNDDSEVKIKIINVLIEIGGLAEYQSIRIAYILIEHLRDLVDKEQIKNNFLTQTFVVMPGLNYSRQNHDHNNKTSDFSIRGTSEGEIEANFNAYTNQIVQNVDDWLINLQLQGADDKSKQVVVQDLAGDIVDRQKYLELNPGSRGSDDDELNYLKYQIFKYINTSPYINCSLAIESAPELMQRIQNVPIPLLTRPEGNTSRQISSPKGARRMNTSQMSMFGPAGPGGSMIETGGRRTVNRRLSSPGAIASGPMFFGNPYMDIDSMPMFGPAGLGGSMIQSSRDVITNRRQSSPGAMPYRRNAMQVITEATDNLGGQRVGTSAAVPESQMNVTKTFKQTNEEYEEFLNNWVQEIPIPAATPQEKDFANKLRQGISNGVWKSLAKVKANPDKYYDTFHIQDFLEDDIEELLDLLPPSQELEEKKFNLKNKFIAQTTGTTKKLKLLLHPSWYKEELIDKFLRVWPRRTVTKTDDEDPIKLFEELQALKLVEDFILYIRYKDDDKVKSNVYRNKLLKNVKDLVVKIKETHGKELQDIDSEKYVNDIFTALHLVPIPDNETIHEEADEILLGIEVDQWYTDLPLIESDDPEEHLKRRRLRDALVKKIHTMEKEASLSNSIVEEELKQETSRFLNKLPIPQDESLNINFMVEELANRVKNRPKSPSPKQLPDRRKSVAFDESVAYDDFSRVMPCCSSFSELPGTRRAQVNETPHTLYMRDSTRSSINYSDEAGTRRPAVPALFPAPVQPRYGINKYVDDPSIHESQQQWLTLDESGAPVKATVAPANQLPSCTNRDSPSQIQVNQSGQCAGQLSVQIPQEIIASIRQDPASMRQATCNQVPLEAQNVSQQVNQSLRLDQVGQQATCGSRIAYQGPIQKNPNHLSMQVQNRSQLYNQNIIPQRLNQSLPLNLLTHQATCSQLPLQSQQLPNQLSMQVQSIPQQVNQSVRLDQPVQASCGTQLPCQVPVQQETPNQLSMRSLSAQIPQEIIAIIRQDPASMQQATCNQVPLEAQNVSQQVNQSVRLDQPIQASCGTQLPGQDPVQIVVQIPNQSIANQTQQPCGAIPRTPLPQTPITRHQTNRETTVADNPTKCFSPIPEETVHDDYIKSVEKAFSSVDLKLSNQHYGKELTVSKSQDLNTNNSDIKLQEDILEWFQVPSNKLQVKMWDKKLKRIAQKLHIPGEEEKLKNKMEKYLKRVPSQFSDCDEDRKDLRQQLPNIFIRKLKKFYLNREFVSPVTVYHVKTPKCYNRTENELRNVIKMWLKGISFKKRDYLGRIVKRNDMLEFINKKLQHFVVQQDRQKPAEEYETSLKCEINDIINEMPILFEGHNKTDFVSTQTNNLVNELLKSDIMKRNINKIENEELRFQNTQKSDQPSANELKDFVTDKITVYLQKSHIGISTNRIICLETDLTNILLDATNSLDDDIGCKFKDKVYIVLKNVGKFTNPQAKQFATSLLKDFQNMLIAKNEKSSLFKSLLSLNNSEPYLVYQVHDSNQNETANPNMTRVTESDLNANKELYMTEIVNQIQEWLTDIKISTSQDEGFLQVAIKDLAGDIVDRHKYLELNPGTRGSDEEELEYLKYQIFKWIYHLVGDETHIVQHAPELMQRIQNTFDPLFKEPQENPERPNQTNTPLIREEEDQPVIDPKQENLRIIRYEDLIDNWMDKVSKPKKSGSIFINTKNENVHELAVNINNIKHRIGNVTADEVAYKLKEAVLEWMKTIPLHGQATTNRDDIADNLVQRIQQCDIDEYVVKGKKIVRHLPTSQTNNPPESSGLSSDIVRDVITDWSRNLPLKPAYCPMEFSSLIDRMAAEITNLLAHPKYGSLPENGKEIMRTIFLYLREFPLQNEHQVQNQLSKMSYLLWRQFIDMDLCRDHSVNSSTIMFKGPRRVKTCDKPLTFLPQSSDPDPHTSQLAGPSSINISCRETAVTESQNQYPGAFGAADINADKVRQLRMFGPTGPGGSMIEHRPNIVSNRRMSYPDNLKYGPITSERPFSGAGNIYQGPTISKPRDPVDLLDYSDIPQGMKIEELQSYFKSMVTEMCKQLPLPKNVSEGDANILRDIMGTCITTTFNSIAADNVIGNDYAYAEYIFEHKINELFKEYPQSPESNSAREAWISKVIAHAMNSISYLQSLTDRDSFRNMLRQGKKRENIMATLKKESEKSLQSFVALAIDRFLQESGHKEDDIIKANIYRRRLTKSLEGHCRDVAKRYFNNNFCKVNTDNFLSFALQYLRELPKTDTNVSIDEAQEILLNEEVDKWYHALPLRDMDSGEIPAMRRRNIELLSKNIHSLEKRIHVDASLLERKIRHEVSVFLENQGQLHVNEDLNINVMVDDLINRLKNIENNRMLGYMSFGRKKPPCSSPYQLGPSAVQQTNLSYQPCTGEIPAAAPGPSLTAAGPTTQDTSHIAGSSGLPYQPCSSQVQPTVGQRLTAESGTQIPKPCSRSVIGQVGACTQAPPSEQSGRTTPSTARIGTTKPVGSQRLDDESEDTDERRRRCRCKYRYRKRRPYYYPDHDDKDPRCYPMPMPYYYRCFY